MRKIIFSLVCTLASSAGLLGGATGAGAAITPASAGTVQADVEGVSCSAPSACTAVGTYDENEVRLLPLVMRWNGKVWERQSVPPGAPNGSALNAVSCPSAAYCLAVGEVYQGSTLPQPVAFAEQWNGTSWSVVPRLPGAGEGSTFSGVSCPSARSCEVLGSKTLSLTASTVLAARWNGKSWATQAVTFPRKGTTIGMLSDVSCSSATRCEAVGSDGSPTSTYPVVAVWNGTSWTTATAPLPKGAATPPEVELYLVSCGSASSCTALGFSTAGKKTTYYSASGSGTTWKDAPVAEPAGATRAFLDGISCAAGTATWCMAVGSYPAAGKRLALAERWNGRAWSLIAAPANSTHAATYLDAVSCPASTTCQAVGEDGVIEPPGLSLTLAEGWNGKSWAVEPTPQPPPGQPSRGTWQPWSSRPSQSAIVSH